MINPFKKKRWGGIYRVVQVTNGLGDTHYKVEVRCLAPNLLFERYWGRVDGSHPTEREAVDAADKSYAAYLKSQTTREAVVE